MSLPENILDLVASSLGVTLAISLNTALGLTLHSHNLNAGYTELAGCWIQFGINVAVVLVGLWIIYRVRTMYSRTTTCNCGD